MVERALAGADRGERDLAFVEIVYTVRSLPTGRSREGIRTPPQPAIPRHSRRPEHDNGARHGTPVPW